VSHAKEIADAPDRAADRDAREAALAGARATEAAPAGAAPDEETIEALFGENKRTADCPFSTQ